MPQTILTIFSVHVFDCGTASAYTVLSCESTGFKNHLVKLTMTKITFFTIQQDVKYNKLSCMSWKKVKNTVRF